MMYSLYRKVYVSVVAEFDDTGTMLPRKIIWEDGRKFPIDRVVSIRPGFAAKVGGQGDKYTVMVNGCLRYLFFERATNLTGNNLGRWFVEGIAQE